MLPDAIGIQKCPWQIHDCLAAPVHHKTWFFCHHSCLDTVQVFLTAQFPEGFEFLCGNDRRHSFLAFGNCQFRAVQSFILHRHGIQVDHQAVREFANGHGDTAGTKVVGLADAPGHLRVPEQALELAFCQRVALLHLGGALLETGVCVLLAGSGGTPDAVAACGPANQNHKVSGLRFFPLHMGFWGSTDHGPDFHALGCVAVVIDFLHEGGGQADLVAIGRVTAGSSPGNLRLWQLVLHGLAHRPVDVAGTCDPHGLVHIAAAGQRIPDRAPDAGGGPAEGLDFRGMVVCLVLEHQQPGRVHSILIHGDFDAAGVDFIRHLQVFQLAGLSHVLAHETGHVHQGGFFPASMDFVSEVQIVFIRLLETFVQAVLFKDHIFQDGFKCGVTAVIGPVGIQHPDLRHGGIPVFIVPEMALHKRQVLQAHGQPQSVMQGSQSLFIHAGEFFNDRNRLHLHILVVVQDREVLPAGFHRVDHVGSNGFFLSLCHVFHLQQGAAADHSGFPAGKQHQALHGRIRPLVVLAGEEFKGNHVFALRFGNFIRHGFRQHMLFQQRHFFFIGSEDVINVVFQQTELLRQIQGLTEFILQGTTFDTEPGFLADKNSCIHQSLDPARTVSAWSFLNCTTFCCTSASATPMIWAARMAAFLDPALPMATVATGTPPGICTVESKESRPPETLVSMGTPMTGSGVELASTPARCAAPPAAAMITATPVSTAVLDSSSTASGVRWALRMRTSKGMPNVVSISMQDSICGRSDRDPITIRTECFTGLTVSFLLSSGRKKRTVFQVR